MGWGVVFAGLISMTSSATVARAPDVYTLDDPPPPHRVTYFSLAAVRLNPLGLVELLTLSFRSRMMRREEPLFQDNFGGLGAAIDLSPGFARIGPLLELQPLSVIRLWATYQLVGVFGTFRQIQSFRSANADYSDTALDRLSDVPEDDPLRNYSTTGKQLTIGLNLQMKMGPLAVRSQGRLVRPDLDLRDGDRVFYDQTYDILAPNRGWYLTNDVDLLYVTDFGLAAGARWNVTGAWYRATRDFEPGETDLELNPTTHRIGPFIAYQISKDPAGVFFNTPTVVFIANWYLKHRWRTGEDINQALPYLALAFVFTGDLWVSDRDAL